MFSERIKLPGREDDACLHVRFDAGLWRTLSGRVIESGKTYMVYGRRYRFERIGACWQATEVREDE